MIQLHSGEPRYNRINYFYFYFTVDVSFTVPIETGLKTVLGQYELFTDRNKKGPITMDYMERRSHARGVYHTQSCSRTRTSRVK